MSKKWINHLGQEVPTPYVPTIDKKKDRLARKYLKKAKNISEKMAALKAELVDEADALYEAMQKDADVRTGKKGNYSISSFDKVVKIEVDVQERIEFDDKINLAQQKIDEFLREKTAGVDHDLQELINSAFKPQKGRLDTKRILGLFKINIKAKKWKEAMELIRQSIDRNISKRYIRIMEKNEAGEYDAVSLNFSSL